MGILPQFDFYENIKTLMCRDEISLAKPVFDKVIKHLRGGKVLK